MRISSHFCPISLPFSSTTSRHNPPQPTSHVLCPLFPQPPPSPHFPRFPPIFQTPKSWFGELVSSGAVSADACDCLPQLHCVCLRLYVGACACGPACVRARERVLLYVCRAGGQRVASLAATGWGRWVFAGTLHAKCKLLCDHPPPFP